MSEVSQEPTENIEAQDNNQQLNDLAPVTQPAADEGEESFTREEMDMIIKRRLETEQGKLNAMKERLEAEYRQKEFRLLARDTLINNGLPPELLDCMNLSDEQALTSSINSINSAINTRVQKDVEKRLAGKTPSAGATTKPDAAVREAWGLNK